MRSLLFVPADSERKLARAPHSGADALILDLEDSVVPVNRRLARRQARDFLVSTTAGGLVRYIRINPLSSGAALDDLAAVVPGKPDGILLPKCVPEDLRTLDHYLAALEVATSISCGTIRVIAIATETPAAMFALGRYAGVSARLEAITWVRRIWRLVSAAAIDGRTEPMTTFTGWRDRSACWGSGCRRRGDRHDLHGLQRRGGARCPVRGGAAIGLRRQDGDPSGAGSGNQPRLFRQRRRTCLGAQGCCRLCREPRGRHDRARRQDDRQAPSHTGAPIARPGTRVRAFWRQISNLFINIRAKHP